MMKLTKKVALEVAMNAVTASAVKEYHYAGSEETFTADEVVEKLRAMMAQLDAKSSAPKKPTKVQQENEGLKETLLRVLESESPKTVSEIMTMDEAFAGMSNQKVAALVRSLVDEGKLVRTEEKRKAYFSIAH